MKIEVLVSIIAVPLLGYVLCNNQIIFTPYVMASFSNTARQVAINGGGNIEIWFYQHHAAILYLIIISAFVLASALLYIKFFQLLLEGEVENDAL